TLPRSELSVIGAALLIHPPGSVNAGAARPDRVNPTIAATDPAAAVPVRSSPEFNRWRRSITLSFTQLTIPLDLFFEPGPFRSAGAGALNSGRNRRRRPRPGQILAALPAPGCVQCHPG